MMASAAAGGSVWMIIAHASKKTQRPPMLANVLRA
jgi:hypothetical protein